MKILFLVIAIFVLVAAGAYFLDLLPITTQPSQNSEPKEVPPSNQTPAPTTIPVPVPTPEPSPSPSTPMDVKFGFTVTEISGSGLSRTISAQLSNTGTNDAHNVSAKVEVFSQDSRVKLGGKESLSVDIGTLKASATVTKQVTLEFSVFDGLKIQQNGAKFVLTVYSDEKTETLYYDYSP